MTEDQGYKHPMSQGIYNTIEGSNYLRASAYMAIIKELERLAKYDNEAQCRTANPHDEHKP